MRAVWAVLPSLLGSALADALDGWTTGPRNAASAMLWLGWAAAAVATCVPMPVCLAAVRVGVGAAVFVGAVAQSPATVVAVVAAAVAARPEVAEWFVNGPAYANEHRYPLRAPGALLLGPLWLASAAVVLAPTAGVLLVADGSYGIGGVVLVAAVGVAYLGGRALVGLTRRWVVFVPAGVVLHDPMALTDPVLFERGVIESLRAAPVGTDSLDLTQAALGLALELVLTEKVPMVLAKGRRIADSGASARLLFTPTRPGRVLREAAARRIPVG